MIRDRGNRKWTAMMLPEHIAKLHDWMEKEHYVERPDLEDFDLQAIQEEIEVAYKRKCQTLIKTWSNGKMEMYQGTIEGIHRQSRRLMLQGQSGNKRIIVDDIVGVQCVD